MHRHFINVAALIFLGACSKPSNTDTFDKEIPVVRVASAVAASNRSERQVAGTVRLKREVVLAFNSGGRIADLLVREGETVRTGQVLARLDLTSLRAAASAATAQAIRADANLKRYSKLAADGWVSKNQFEASRAEAAATKAQVAQTQFDYKLGTLIATNAGVVLRRSAEPGQVVTPGSPVLVIGDTRAGFVLQLSVTDADIGSLRLGQRAPVTLSGLTAANLVGTVTEIGARSDDATATFLVELSLPALPGLRSGLIGSATLSVENDQVGANAVTIPVSAVFGARADEGFVYTYDQSAQRVRTRLVKLGPLSDTTVTVLSGLAPGETVVVSRTDRLRNEMTVKRAPL